MLILVSQLMVVIGVSPALLGRFFINGFQSAPSEHRFRALPIELAVAEGISVLGSNSRGPSNASIISSRPQRIFSGKNVLAMVGRQFVEEKDKIGNTCEKRLQDLN
jgi:hypothetical protein